eukprot:CAMPEP_0198329172 /NCGR_PEP_ID=MMETSP1450-20131203/15995_1 /TAXON_ID=753684 ORGANISM="Madagascaria erythrocladiodes, Strain CCMP3234" /NCGR_SAMPLE_ID=MMETSP1450 /ASSEMBLY_ACC=CAM_ASM_001115 /LENGTH=381 /DNA_ID=CAMNT_0044033367 /DNA_START=296 /DNA_END=1438 /DNA_ORIENTATION=+
MADTEPAPGSLSATVPKFRHGMPAEMHGWMYKKSDRMFSTKKRRYFILEAQELSCHHQPNVSPTWEASVQDAHVEGDEAQLRITVECEGRTVQMIAFSQEDYDKWMQALQRAASRRIEDYYNLGKLIGEGGFAKVVVGTDSETNEKFAVKVISKQNSDDEEMEFLARELNIMKRVNHPNVIQTFDIFDSKKHLYIVLEYMEAGTLHEVYQKSRPFTEDQARSVVKDIMQGVDYLHSRNIVHRDLKLKNILCQSSTFPLNCKLADFGLSNFVGARTMSKVILQSQVGSPHYVAPEVLSGGLYGPGVDIWSVGVIAHVLLTGKYPFAGKTMQETLERVAKGRVMFKDAVWKDVQLEAFSFVKDCLRDQPEERLTAESALKHPW